MALNSAPSVRRLLMIPGVTEDIANEIRRQIHDLPWVSPSIIRQIMKLVPGSYGCEYIIPKPDSKAPTIYYANMGDTYARTLMMTYNDSTVVWSVCSWGCIVESYDGKYEQHKTPFPFMARDARQLARDAADRIREWGILMYKPHNTTEENNDTRNV